MPIDQETFSAGKFYYRVLAKSLDSDSVIIDDPRWGESETLFRFENISTLIQDQVMKQIDLADAPFASWLLARLWFLTKGMLRDGLNIYEENRGCQDGGWYYCQLVIEDEQRALAIIYVEGCSYYQDVSIKECSEAIEPVEIIEALASELAGQPLQLAICDIVIEDPEESMKPYSYGWDGNKFLGQRSLD